MRKLCTIKVCFLDADTNRLWMRAGRKTALDASGGPTKAEYARRLADVKQRMAKAGFDLIICQDPSASEGGGERLCDVTRDPIFID